MAYEIVSTSSPNNLEGKTGFGTVIKTQRLPIAIDIAVSGLNGYTHLFGAGDPKNPICWSYLQIRADNKTYYVLSRIADSGADHTLRSNRLASHLILQSRELTSCSAGPAAIMQGGEIISSYNGSAREVPERVLKPYSAQSPKVCQRWKQLTGDAGWAGLLAESVMSNKSAYVIYNPGTDLLPLFAEAINLIPASFRWKATFSTYYSSQVERYNCLWRGIVIGSPSANAIPQGDYVVIDLTKPLPALNKTSNMITLARKGSAVNPISQPSPTSMDSVVNKGASGTISMSPLPSVESTIPDPMTNSPMSKQPVQPVYIKQKASLKGVWITMFLLFLLIGATGGGLYYTIDAINKSLAANHQNLSEELSSVQDAFNSFQKDYSTWKMQTDSWKNQMDSKSKETSGNQKGALDELKKKVDRLSSALTQQKEDINKRIDDKFDPLKNSIDEINSKQGSHKESTNKESTNKEPTNKESTNEKNSPSHYGNNANNDNSCEERVKKLEDQVKKLEEQMEKSKLTAVLRIEKTFDIKKVACAFYDGSTKNIVQKITGEKWIEIEMGTFQTSVTIDEAKIELTYITAEKKFIARIYNDHARNYLEQHPFSVASSDPIYFY